MNFLYVSAIKFIDRVPHSLYEIYSYTYISFTNSCLSLFSCFHLLYIEWSSIDTFRRDFRLSCRKIYITLADYAWNFAREIRLDLLLHPVDRIVDASSSSSYSIHSYR